MKRKLNFEIGLLVAAVVLVSFALQGCTTARIVNLKKSIGTGGSQHTTQEVKEAILKACAELGWNAAEEEAGLIKASLDIRTHRAEVEIPYTSSSYSINYFDSRNLKHSGDWIHKNYNLWTAYLSNAIDRNLR